MSYTIQFGTWRIPNTAAVHAFLVLRDNDTGQIVRELNGGARGPNGTFDYVGILGTITARETIYASPPNLSASPRFGARRESEFTNIASGSQQDMLAAWNAGVACAAAIDGKDLTYFFLGTNSNSVAVTLTKCMGLTVPPTPLLQFRPGSLFQLLPDSEINEIRRQRLLSPIKYDENGTVSDGALKDANRATEYQIVPLANGGHVDTTFDVVDAQPRSWRNTVVDSQNRLIQTTDHVDWGRVGSGQADVQTMPQYRANGQPTGEPERQLAEQGRRLGDDCPPAAPQQEFSPQRPEFYGDPLANERASNADPIREPDAVREEGQEQATDRAGFRQQAVVAHLARIDQAKQRIPDFDQVIRSGGQVPIAPGVADEILNSEKSALLQYHLAGNPDKLAELNGLSELNLAREIGRLESRLYLPTARTVTAALRRAGLCRAGVRSGEDGRHGRLRQLVARRPGPAAARLAQVWAGWSGATSGSGLSKGSRISLRSIRATRWVPPHRNEAGTPRLVAGWMAIV